MSAFFCPPPCSQSPHPYYTAQRVQNHVPRNSIASSQKGRERDFLFSPSSSLLPLCPFYCIAIPRDPKKDQPLQEGVSPNIKIKKKSMLVSAFLHILVKSPEKAKKKYSSGLKCRDIILPVARFFITKLLLCCLLVGKSHPPPHPPPKVASASASSAVSVSQSIVKVSVYPRRRSLPSITQPSLLFLPPPSTRDNTIFAMPHSPSPLFAYTYTYELNFLGKGKKERGDFPL